jgi:valyl-tRNA synthetase
MWHFKYPLAGGATYDLRREGRGRQRDPARERDYISIATTRPETMLGDGAVAVHPSDERYAPIVGKLCEIPVGPKEHRRLIPIITDDYPDPISARARSRSPARMTSTTTPWPSARASPATG